MRVSAGSMLAVLSIAIIFGLWRIAATYDSATGNAGWLWLVFEAAMLLWTFPFLAIAFCGLGVWLVHKGTGARLHSVLGSSAIMALYGLALAAFGLIGIEEAGPLSSAQVSIGVLLIAGAIGGYVGHAGWFPIGVKLEDDV